MHSHIQGSVCSSQPQGQGLLLHFFQQRKLCSWTARSLARDHSLGSAAVGTGTQCFWSQTLRSLEQRMHLGISCSNGSCRWSPQINTKALGVVCKALKWRRDESRLGKGVRQPLSRLEGWQTEAPSTAYSPNSAFAQNKARQPKMLHCHLLGNCHNNHTNLWWLNCENDAPWNCKVQSLKNCIR